MKNTWLAPGSAGSPGPTARSNGDTTDATWWNYLGDDIRAWGGDVSAEGHNLNNLAQITQDSWNLIGAITAFLNSWVNYGSPTPLLRFRTDKQGCLVINGAIKSGTTTDGTIVFILPVGFRPAYDQRLPIYATGTNPTLFVEAATGKVQIYGVTNNAIVWINVRFPLD